MGTSTSKKWGMVTKNKRKKKKARQEGKSEREMCCRQPKTLLAQVFLPRRKTQVGACTAMNCRRNVEFLSRAEVGIFSWHICKLPPSFYFIWSTRLPLSDFYETIRDLSRFPRVVSPIYSLRRRLSPRLRGSGLF